VSGGPLYTLGDPRPIAAEAPYTYYLPSAPELAAIEPGDVVQLIFRGLAPGLKYGAERMWVTVISADGDTLTGRLENRPHDIPGLEPGEIATFERHHVIDIRWGEERGSPPASQLACDHRRQHREGRARQSRDQPDRTQQVERKPAGQLGQLGNEGRELHPEEIEVLSHREVEQLVAMKAVPRLRKQMEEE